MKTALPDPGSSSAGAARDEAAAYELGRMAAIVEEIFTDSYLEAFYKAHVASRRSSSLDEDIAAIEAEITK